MSAYLAARAWRAHARADEQGDDRVIATTNAELGQGLVLGYSQHPYESTLQAAYPPMEKGKGAPPPIKPVKSGPLVLGSDAVVYETTTRAGYGVDLDMKANDPNAHVRICARFPSGHTRKQVVD
jgi:hypothetical protein